jgi:hypothetical protein
VSDEIEPPSEEHKHRIPTWVGILGVIGVSVALIFGLPALSPTSATINPESLPPPASPAADNLISPAPDQSTAGNKRECVWINSWQNGGNREADNIPTICAALRKLKRTTNLPQRIYLKYYDRARHVVSDQPYLVNPGCQMHPEQVVVNGTGVCVDTTE